MKLQGLVQRDKLLHAETCALIVLVLSRLLPVWAAAGISLLCGITKEVWDIKHGVPSWRDLAWDGLGILLGSLLSLI